ncbi:MAG: 50S ribosomal protein L20 [Bacilli bacterium]|nr:50S ribosomal protein L20 [Bacilli bacterium]
MRVKNSVATRARRKRILKRAKGYFGSKHLLFKTAKEQVLRSLRYSYIDRRKLKSDMRKLWIKRINAACRNYDISYSMFINGLNKAGVKVNRKMLSELAINDQKAFADLVEIAKKAVK